ATSSGSLDIQITDSVPVAVNDTNSIFEDASPNTVSGSVLTNDTVGADANATPITAASPTLAYGTLVLNADGSYTYTLDNTNPTVNALNTGDTLTDSYTYTLTDGDGTSTTATLEITINGSNDGPVANLDAAIAVEAGGVANGSAGVNPTGNVLTNDTDVDAGDTKTVSAISGGVLNGATNGAFGTLTLNADGSYSYALNNANATVQALRTSANTLTDTFTYTMRDAAGATSTSTLTVTIQGANDAPVAVVDIASVTENNTVSRTAMNGVLANDTDVDAGDTKTVTGVSFGASNVTAGNALVGTYGTLTLNADGSYSYSANRPAADALAAGATATDTFTYTMRDAAGLTSSTTLALTITGTNDAPVVGTSTVSVSEEGLALGLPDALGNPVDTTNLSTQSGTISIVDPDSAVTVSLSGPAGITAGGVAVTWTGNGSAGSPLIGSAGGAEVLRATIDSNGNYTVTLSKAIDHPAGGGENVAPVNLTVTASDGAASSSGVITVNVEDDAPNALASTQVVTLPAVDTNIMLMLDVSGSMGSGAGSRLEIMKQSVNEMLDQYDNLGDVMVRVVTFSSNASAYQTSWVSVAAAKAYVGALGSGGSTNYDAALLRAMDAFDDPGRISGAQNVSYFLTDGAPTVSTDWNSAPYNHPGALPNQSGIQGSEEAIWANFLNTNGINSFAYGMGTGATLSNMNPVAYDGTTGTNTNAIVVSNINDLPPILRDSIVAPTDGDLTSGTLGAGSALGADGGAMASITLDGTTYNDGGAVSGTNRGVYNAGTNSWTVQTLSGGKFVVDMDNGQYEYTPTAKASAAFNEVVGYTLVDNDGDTATSTLTITVEPPHVVNLSATASTITGVNLGLAGEYFGYNDNRDGTAGDPKYAGSGATRLHSDDGSADAGAANNVDRLADVEAIVEGRNGNPNLINNAILSNPMAADATFSANKLEYGVFTGTDTSLFSNDLGQNGRVTSGAIGASAAVGGANNLYTFLKVAEGNADGLAATGGLGDTTDAIVRMVGYIYIPAGGVYDLRVTADDGYRVLIGGQNVAQADFIQSTATQTYTGVTLTEGLQPIEVLYWDQGGAVSLRVEVKDSGAANSTYKIIGTDEFALFAPDDVPTLTANQDIVESSTNGVYQIRTGATYSGDDAAEKIIGTDGKDVIHGGAGNDIIQGGAGSDHISGGAGNDTLTGGLGADVFAWSLADKGTAGAPSLDRVTDFDIAPVAAGGDSLDLRDLLVGEARGVADAGNLADFLHFESSGGNTIVHVSSSGGFSGGYNAGNADATITLDGVNLFSGGLSSDQQVIQDLLSKGKLITD
ncbi:VCBS domain-containing protein, partial [Zoogloeaceae bacterium G21618-S1]|nr:VCBS domain-containing protein [Zoogloeaceae bacterium G21618-S1]